MEVSSPLFLKILVLLVLTGNAIVSFIINESLGAVLGWCISSILMIYVLDKEIKK